MALGKWVSHRLPRLRGTISGGFLPRYHANRIGEARPMRNPMFFRQVRNECFKLFSRKRTYLGFGIFLAINLLMLWLLKQPLPRKGLQSLLVNNGFRVEDFMGGLTVAAFTMAFTVPLISGLYLALVSGELVAREADDGTLRLVLARPITRRELFIAKALVSALHTALLMFF